MKVDPYSTARMWAHHAPKNETRINQMEVWTLVGKVSDRETNVEGIKAALGMRGRFIKVYEREICGGLLFCSNRSLGKAVGGISPERSEIMFWAGEDKIGHLSFIPRALVYYDDDRAMFAGFVHHELRHAMDFMDTGIMPENDYMKMGSSGGYEIDEAAYARNIFEMRAHVEQAMGLVRIMGGPENAKGSIRNSQFARGLVPETVATMISFIDNFYDELKENIDPPAIVARSEDHDVRSLVMHLEKAIELVRFSNNVKGR